MKIKNISLSSTEKLNFISNVSTMLSAGIPILSVIDSLAEEGRGNVKKILEEIHKDLLQGKHLYASFAKFPRVFDSVTVNMVRAAEESGMLDVVLKDMKAQIKKDIALNRKIRTALTYPAVVMLVFFGVLFTILVVAIPKISTVFAQLKTPLPLPTKILIFLSNLILHNTILVIIGCTLIVAGLAALYRWQQKRITTMLCSLPIVATVVRDIDLLRFSRSLHLLLTAGIPITGALELTEQVVVRPDIVKALAHAKQTVLTGKTLSFSFKQHKKIFPSTMIELVQAGEKTGTLDRSLIDIAEYFDYKVADSLEVLTALLEPVMLVLVAILVGGMIVSIIGPIYGMIGQISPH